MVRDSFSSAQSCCWRWRGQGGDARSAARTFDLDADTQRHRMTGGGGSQPVPPTLRTTALDAGGSRSRSGCRDTCRLHDRLRCTRGTCRLGVPREPVKRESPGTIPTSSSGRCRVGECCSCAPLERAHDEGAIGAREAGSHFHLWVNSRAVLAVIGGHRWITFQAPNWGCELRVYRNTLVGTSVGHRDSGSLGMS